MNTKEKSDWTEAELDKFHSVMLEYDKLVRDGITPPIIFTALRKAYCWEKLNDEEIEVIDRFANNPPKQAWNEVVLLARMSFENYDKFRVNGFKGVKQQYVVNGEVNF